MNTVQFLNVCYETHRIQFLCYIPCESRAHFTSEMILLPNEFYLEQFGNLSVFSLVFSFVRAEIKVAAVILYTKLTFFCALYLNTYFCSFSGKTVTRIREVLFWPWLIYYDIWETCKLFASVWCTPVSWCSRTIFVILFLIESSFFFKTYKVTHAFEMLSYNIFGIFWFQNQKKKVKIL